MTVRIEERPSSSRLRMSGALGLASAYALLATLGAGLALAVRDVPPWVHPDPWFALRPAAGVTLSLGLGLGFACLVVIGTRLAVGRFVWARRLHGELRPVARGLSDGQIVLLALLSSLGEELLFRALLAPWLGVIGSAVIFGLAHQVKGTSRWVWVSWATAVGLVQGAMFATTGSLAGPILAHAVINGVNLGFLRDHDIEAS